MSFVARAASLYQKSVSKTLAKYGIKYDDALVETRPVQTAMEWMSKEDYTGRTRRIARAADCGLKRTYLPDEIQSIQRPLDNYLYDNALVAEEIQEERAELTRW